MRNLLILPVFLLSTLAHADEQTRNLPAFSTIDSKGPISIVVEAGKPQSVTVSGSARFVGAVETKVVGNELRISIPERGVGNLNDDPRVTITVPELTRLAVEGAGETILNKLHGNSFELNYAGAGSVKADGTVKNLRMKAEGVGAIDTKALIAARVDVMFQGVGDIKLYASEHLSAVVQGMGSLTYYGNPRTFHKSVQGLGSVSAGK